MLGTVRTWTARPLDVFLELIPRSTPPAALSYDSRTRPSCIFMRGLIFFFVFHFPGHFWKTNLDSGKAGWQIFTICQRPHYSKQHKLCLGKKGFFVKMDTEAKKVWKKRSVSQYRSDGIVQGLFLLPDFIPNSLLFTCQRKRVLRCRPGCTCKMFPIGFLLFVPVFTPLVPPSAAKMIEDRGESMDLRDCVDRVWFCWKTEGWRDEIIGWRQMIMNQGVVVN